MTALAVPGIPGETFTAVRGTVDLRGDRGALLLNWPIARTQNVTAIGQLADALAELVDSIDPEEGCENWDLSTCDYYRGKGTCDFGCRDEPQCQTCRPEGGWPLEVARRVLAGTAALR